MVSRKNSQIRVFRKAIFRVMNNGGKVVVNYVHDGKVQLPVTGRLHKSFDPRHEIKCIDLDISTETETYSQHLPAKTKHLGVQKMTDEYGRLLYTNKSIGNDYGAKSEDN